MGKVVGWGLFGVCVLAVVVKVETGISLIVWIERLIGGN